MTKQTALEAYIANRVTVNRAIIDQGRMAFACPTKGLDLKHGRLWNECGYPEDIQPQEFRFAYERHPAAAAGVNRVLEKCWDKYPEVLEEGADDKVSSPWELSVAKMLKRAFPFIKDADRRNLINRYSCLLLRINDGRRWDEPVDTVKTKRLKDRAIVGYIPAWEEQIEPSAWNQDETSMDYGAVTMWMYQESLAFDTQTSGKPTRSLSIHPDRVIVLAEGSMDGSIYSGVPLLRAGYNSLIDMAKVSGSAAEGFLKNASRQLSINYNGDNVSADGLAHQMGVRKEELFSILNEDIARLNEAIDAAMFTMGGDVKVLSVAPADPEPSWTVAANQFAASIRKPFTIIFGQQTGRLASDEDKIDDASTAQQRRNGFLDFVIGETIDRYIAFGIVDAAPANGYYVKWNDLMAPSDLNRAELLGKLATANKSFYDAGQTALITVDEARALAGMEPIDLGDIGDGEGDPEEEDANPEG